jgi:L-fuculose-phosphate aldolase
LYEELNAHDIVQVGLDGIVRVGYRKPSSEWRFHRDIYAAHAGVGAIVHAHAQHSTALACLRREIPAFHYMVAKAGGNTIPCADYATFGTQALSDAVVSALQQRRACLMANHGMIATGATLPAALMLAQEVESLAALYCQALLLAQATGTTPVLLDDAEMARVANQFAGYGQAG